MTEYRCIGCGYGAVPTRLLPVCPMCSGTVWALVAGRRESSVTVEVDGAAHAVITLTRQPQPRDFEALTATVAAVVHDAPDVVVDLTRVPELPAEVRRLLPRLGALARGAGGHLSTRCPPGALVQTHGDG